MEIISVPAVVSIVYAIIAAITKATGENETFKRFIPLVAMGLGILIGLLAYYFLPGIIVADNAVAAMITGGMSGLAATGTDQIIKQLTDVSNTIKDDLDTTPEDPKE